MAQYRDYLHAAGAAMQASRQEGARSQAKQLSLKTHEQRTAYLERHLLGGPETGSAATTPRPSPRDGASSLGVSAHDSVACACKGTATSSARRAASTQRRGPKPPIADSPFLMPPFNL